MPVLVANPFPGFQLIGCFNYNNLGKRFLYFYVVFFQIELDK